MDKLNDDVEKVYRKLSKEIKGIKNSILYDLNKKVEAIKNTIALNVALVPGKKLRNCKDNLGIQFLITTYDAFIEFDNGKGKVNCIGTFSKICFSVVISHSRFRWFSAC